MTPLLPLTDAEIDELAMEIVTNVVYVPLDADALDASFRAILVLAGGAPDGTGLIVERYDRASPISVNGYPAFLSFQAIHKDSVEALFERCDAKAAALRRA